MTYEEMASDAGYRGEEARQVAAALEERDRAAADQQWAEEQEQAAQEEQSGMSGEMEWTDWPQAVAVKAIASALNDIKNTALYSLDVHDIAPMNIALARTGLRVQLFMHGGMWDVGLMPPEKARSAHLGEE